MVPSSGHEFSISTINCCHARYSGHPGRLVVLVKEFLLNLKLLRIESHSSLKSFGCVGVLARKQVMLTAACIHRVFVGIWRHHVHFIH